MHSSKKAAGSATQTVDVSGYAIRYLQHGDGDDVAVLIHGFGGDLDGWLFNHEALAAQCTVYALDLPGHGGSTKDVGDGSLGTMAGVVNDFLAMLDVPKAHLVGHSMGGAVALELARQQVDRVQSLTLIASAGLGTEIDGEYIDGFVGADRRKELKPHLQKLFADPKLVTRQLIDDLMAWATQDRFIYRHRWRPNDVLMWDNRWVIHVVEPFDHGSERRVMHRTSIAGSEPVKG